MMGEIYFFPVTVSREIFYTRLGVGVVGWARRRSLAVGHRRGKNILPLLLGGQSVPFLWCECLVKLLAAASKDSLGRFLDHLLKL